MATASAVATGPAGAQTGPGFAAQVPDESTTSTSAGTASSTAGGVPAIDAVGGFTVTISWGDTQDGEPIVLGAAISETGVWPPAPSQIAEPVFCTGDQGGGQPEARVNDYTYLRDRFQSASVDVYVTWSEYCAGDPFDEQDTVPYTLVVYQLPEYVSGASEPVELRRIEGRYPVGYRGNSLAMEQRVATVKVTPAPGGGGG